MNNPLLPIFPHWGEMSDQCKAVAIATYRYLTTPNYAVTDQKSKRDKVFIAIDKAVKNICGYDIRTAMTSGKSREYADTMAIAYHIFSRLTGASGMQIQHQFYDLRDRSTISIAIKKASDLMDDPHFGNLYKRIYNEVQNQLQDH